MRNFNDLEKMLFQNFIGLDNVLPAYGTYSKPSFPPYNVIREKDNYNIVIALAGYKAADIEIVTENNKLKIGTIEGFSSPENTNVHYMHRGLAMRSFKLSFDMTPDLKIDSANFVDGLLTVSLHLEIPEEKLPKKIAISTEALPLLTNEESIKEILS